MTSKAFKDYMKENEREYHARIKTVVPLEDDHIAQIERVLDKYVLLDMTSPIKTIMQSHPMDFTDITNAEVFIVDITVALPISAYVLMKELQLALNIPEKYIVVRSPNDPREVEGQRQVANDEIDAEASESGLSPAARLSTDSDYDEDERGDLDEPIYGDEYNSKFLETLAQVAAERQQFAAIPDDAHTKETSNEIVMDAPDVRPEDNFNEDVEGAPPVYSFYAETLKNLRKKDKTGKSRLSTKGNYDDDEVNQSKKFTEYGKTDKVKTVLIKNKKAGIRKK